MRATEDRLERLALATKRALSLAVSEIETGREVSSLFVLSGSFDIFPKDIDVGTLTREQGEELARVREELQAGLDRDLRAGLRAREEAIS